MTEERRGIAGIGTWIMDHVRMVDAWPEEQTLTYVHGEHFSGGGLAYNLVIDIGTWGIGIPLMGVGFVGDDDDGRRILEDCDRLGVDRTQIRKTSDAPTSYTEVITRIDTGSRTFFHSKGANNLVTFDSIQFDSIPSRIAHVGYLLLMDGLDSSDSKFGTTAARILAQLQDLGIRTSIDTVSVQSTRFTDLIPPALKHTDYVILNEIEAGRTTGHEILRGESVDGDALRASSRKLLDVGMSELAVIHMHLGAYARTRDGEELFQPSLDLPEGFIQGGAGAGDAFCAGILAGMHEGWGLDRSMRFATAAGATCLSDPTCTGGIRSAEETWKMLEQHPFRPMPI